MAKGMTEPKDDDLFTRKVAKSPDLQLALAIPMFDQTSMSEVRPLTIAENMENNEDVVPLI